MKKNFLVLVFLGVPALTGLVVYQLRARAYSSQLDQCRSTLGSRPAGALLEQLGATHPRDAEVQFLRSQQLRLEGKLDQAGGCLDQAEKLGWPRAEIDRQRLLLLALRDFHQAEPRLEAELDSRPDDRDVLLVLAAGAIRSHQRDRALLLLQRILDRQPGDGFALYLRGRVRFEGRQLPETRQDLEEALRIGPDRHYAFAARLLLANCCLDLGDFEQSLRLYRLCQGEQPDNPRVLYGIGLSTRFLNRWTEAQEAFEMVLRVQPHHLDSLLQLAYVYEQRGELHQAVELLERANQEKPDLYVVHFQLAKLLRADGQPERAAEHEHLYQAIEQSWKTKSGGAIAQQALEARDRPTSPRNPLDPDPLD